MWLFYNSYFTTVVPLVFSSTLFLLFFLPLFLGIYAAVPDKLRNAWLLLGSLLFYGYGAPEFLWILLSSALVNYYLVQWMHQRPSFRSLGLLTGVLLNVGLLLVYKYANFAAGIYFDLRGDENTWKSIALPIGISFFTFQSLSYNIDVYRGEQQPLKNPFLYLIYIFSFPQMIAGPIVRYGVVAKELVSRPFTRENVILGTQRFVVGLSKKVFIANTVAEAFPIDGVGEWTAIGAWSTILAYTLQIYFDFSGYSDMAIGLGRIMGFSFPENFNRPYSAKSFTDFWRRWHMTLSFWMRDYLYVSLGGNRRGTFRTYLNLLVVFVVSGFWHGASWNFLFWGLFHGFFLVMERAFLLRYLEQVPKVVSRLWTFLWVVLGWSLFALEDFDQLNRFLHALFQPTSLGTWTAGLRASLAMLVGILLVFFPVFKLWERLSDYAGISIRSWLFHGAAAILALAELAASDFNPFIYFRF